MESWSGLKKLLFLHVMKKRKDNTEQKTPSNNDGESEKENE